MFLLCRCAFCDVQCGTDFPYLLGRVRGHLCRTCSDGLNESVAAFARKRQRELRALRIRLAAEQQRLSVASLELVPRTFRRLG